MKSIVFIGLQDNQYFAKEYADSNNYEFISFNETGYLTKYTNEIIRKCREKDILCLIVDVENYFDDANVMVKELNGLKQVLKTKIIAFTPSLVANSNLTYALKENDIKNFILSGSMTDLKDQLEKNLNSYYDAVGREEIKEIIEEEQKVIFQKNKCKTVGIVGTCSRIGTTTQAIGICQYFLALGYNACYVQANNNQYFDISINGNGRSCNYVEKFIKIEKLEENFTKEPVIYNGIEMYSHIENEELLNNKEKYDFIVYDYGVFIKEFNQSAFLKDDFKIAVVGGSANERDLYRSFISLPIFKNVNFIFSFVPKNIQEKIKVDLLEYDYYKIIDKKEIKTNRIIVFADDIRDPFCFEGTDFYNHILPIEENPEAHLETKKEKKRKFFRKRR